MQNGTATLEANWQFLTKLIILLSHNSAIALLDIYPNDKDMIALFNQYRTELNRLKEEYQSKYGPIMTDSNANQVYPFAWINSPWPWEGK